jgi:hypothetical protein
MCHMRLAVGGTCGGDAPAFDRVAAGRALGVSVASCQRDGGPAGAGRARVTFQPTGDVSAVELDAPFDATPVGACVARRYRAAKVPAFAGAAVSVRKSFTLE